MGYSDSSKAYRLHNFSDGNVIVSRDVVFFENEYREVIVKNCNKFNQFFEYSAEQNEIETGDDSATAVDVIVNEFADVNSSTEGNTSDGNETFDGNDAVNSTVVNEADESVNRSTNEGEAKTDSIIELSSTEEATANSDSTVAENQAEDDNFESFTNEGDDDTSSDYEPSQVIETPRPNYAEMVFAYNATSLQEPISVNDALSRPDAKQWEIAMKEEIDSLRENDTWELVQLPADRKPLTQNGFSN